MLGKSATPLGDCLPCVAFVEICVATKRSWHFSCVSLRGALFYFQERTSERELIFQDLRDKIRQTQKKKEGTYNEKKQ